MSMQSLAQTLAKHTGLSQAKAADLLRLVWESLAETLAQEGRVRLGNYGTFEVKVRKARASRNPRTGERLLIPQRKVVTFKAGKELKERATQSPTPASGPSGAVESPEDIEKAREAAQQFLLEVRGKQEEAVRRLSSPAYISKASPPLSYDPHFHYPREKERVAEAIRADLGGDFDSCTVTPSWKLFSNGVRFVVHLEIVGVSRRYYLDLTREGKDWKVQSIFPYP